MKGNCTLIPFLFIFVVFLRYQGRCFKPKVKDDAAGKALLCFLQIDSPYVVEWKAFWVKWVCPPNGVLKLNTDGASRQSSRVAGGGAVVRNEWGKIVELCVMDWN